MGLFSKQKPSVDEEIAERERHFLDENFKEELRNHARLYFETVLKENGERFASELHATVESLNGELKEHIAARLDTAIDEVKSELKDHVSRQVETQLAEQAKAMKDVQDKALADITHSAEALAQQHQALGQTLQKSLADQEATLSSAFEDSKAQMAKMKDSHQLALQWMSQTVQALQAQHEQLAAGLQQQVAAQEALLIKAFEENMAQIIEQYLLGTLGDQYDLKAQLPSIIKQLEANKQAITDDMKL